MALDISGIRNIEFYSEHYLEAVLERDLKGVFTRWAQAKREQGKPLPSESLLRQSNAYFKAASQAENERDITTRWEIAREFHVGLLEALGYPYQPAAELIGDNEYCPVLLAMEKDGHPYLWVVDAPFTEEEDDDPFEAIPFAEQLPKNMQDVKLPHENTRTQLNWRQIFDSRLFRTEAAPRWVLFLVGREVYLLERNKWPQGRYLAFNLAELFRRNQATALKAAAGLLHRDVLAPDSGICLHDSLDESSHKHAYAVSSDLKYGVRRAVELLGNEAVNYRREVQKQGVFDSEEFTAEILTTESLTWLYRLLFLFYVEARGGELGIVPMNAEIYREGYSLENLRDLEMVELSTEHARNGYYLHDSLRTLFKIVNEGYGAEQGSSLSLDLEQVMHDSMMVQPLNSPLFDNSRFRIIKNIRIRNFVLQEILRLLSLSAEKRRKTRGRISYAQLGINQLGSVYEGLLSYSGFFAKEDLYEVAAEKDCKKLSGKSAAEREALKTYFVPESRIADYKVTEIVKDENERKVVHKKGTFIFRLAGRNREKSASYYTPEVLTQCLVKYALKELLWEEGEEGEKPTHKKTADEILALTICEPAMGSSAFLIEAVDQLADAYLEARQEEVKARGGETIPPEDYQREKRRVKARLATNNCYGVDLNPTAVELAKVSLWLATLHEDGKCPWFGLRLATGNSLVGARREVFKTADVTRKGTKDAPNWLGLVPEPVPLHHGEGAPSPDEVDWANWTAPPRPKGTIYHFLLPAEGMAAFDKDKVIKQLAPESVKRIKEWRKEFCKPFNKKDAERLEQISDAVDRLFAQVVRERVLATQETSDRIPVWGEAGDGEGSAQQADLLVRDQEEVAASLEDGSSAYRRIKLAMDAWCALWFWPIEEAGLLPDRATWLAQMELILKGQVSYVSTYEQGNLFADLALTPRPELAASQRMTGNGVRLNEVSTERLKRLHSLSDAFCERRGVYFEECGLADIDAVLEGDASLQEAQSIADSQRFHHWPLRFAEVFASRDGFDLVLGNPPWVKIEWSEGAILAESEPLLDVRGLRSGEIATRSITLLESESVRADYLSALVETLGTQIFLSDLANYPTLGGMQTNVYKCFMTKAWDVGSPASLMSFIHEANIFDEKSGATLREALYRRMRLCARFINEYPLFPEVGHQKKFCMSSATNQMSDTPRFKYIANLIHPRTIDDSFDHDGRGAVPGIKTVEDEWEVSGHSRRILDIGSAELRLFASLYDSSETPELHARLPVVHSEDLVEVLSRIQSFPVKVGDRVADYFCTQHWHETGAVREDTISRKTRYPATSEEWILSGPHIFVANPLYQTPNEICETHGAYTRIDLVDIDETYLPRTNYVPASIARYRERMPRYEGSPITEFFRHVHKAFANPVSERTLVSAILPREAAHIHVLNSLVSRDSNLICDLAGLTASLTYDFYFKCKGSSSIYESDLKALPLPSDDRILKAIRIRSLRLNCVSSLYAELWARCFDREMIHEKPTSDDRRVIRATESSEEWDWGTPLRADLVRRLALVELDVLSAIALGLSIGQLAALYRVQFPVLQQYERERRYDQHGRIVPTSKTAAGNPAVSLVELAATLKEQAGFDIHAEYHPDGSNTQELRKQKIRLGKKEADVLGVSERCTMADLLAETEVRWSDEDHPEGRPVRLVGLSYTDPGLEPRMERVYPTPWTRCDREADYRQAWAEFERRLGRKFAGESAFSEKIERA